MFCSTFKNKTQTRYISDSDKMKPFMKNTDLHYFMLEAAEAEKVDFGLKWLTFTRNIHMVDPIDKT